MFEITGVSDEIAREALRLASHKLPIKSKIRDQSRNRLRPRLVVKQNEGE